MTEIEGNLAPITPPTSLEDPTTGEVVSTEDVDGLAAMWMRLRDLEDRCRRARVLIIHQLEAKVAHMSTKTRRLRGETVRIKIQMPDDSWDQVELRKAWDAHPTLAAKYLRIARLEPKLIEVRKLDSETGDTGFEVFRDRVLQARRPPTGNPYVTIEGAASDD